MIGFLRVVNGSSVSTHDEIEWSGDAPLLRGCQYRCPPRHGTGDAHGENGLAGKRLAISGEDGPVESHAHVDTVEVNLHFFCAHAGYRHVDGEFLERSDRPRSDRQLQLPTVRQCDGATLKRRVAR